MLHHNNPNLDMLPQNNLEQFLTKTRKSAWSLLLAATCLNAVMGTAALSQNIDTTGSFTIGGLSIGTPNQYYFGQTITPTTDQTRLDSFTFWGQPNNVNTTLGDLTGSVYRYDSSTGALVGAALYSGAVTSGQQSSLGSYAPMTVSVGGIELEAGQQYTLIMASTNSSSAFALSWTSNDPYPAGNGFYLVATNIPNISGTVPEQRPRDFMFIAELGVWVVLPSPIPSPSPGISDAQFTSELQLQAAQQGVMLSEMQSRAVVGQLRQRMQAGGVDRTPTGSIVHAYASEAKNDYADVFSFANADNSARWTAWADTGADGLRGNWNPDVRGYQASQQFGLDYRFANGWVAGAAIGASVFNTDFDNGGELSGNAYWISPYLGMQFDNWMVTLQTAYTYVDYDSFNTGTGISGDTHGQRFSGSISVARQFDLGNAFYMIPEVTLSAGRERISDVAALTSGSVENPRFFSSKIGGELGYNVSADARVYGLTFAEYVKTNADASTTYLSTGYKAKDWSATLGGGFDMKLADRTSISLEGRARGIGSDTLIYGGNARLNVRF